VQRVEEADQVVGPAAVVGGVAGDERDPVGHAGVGGPLGPLVERRLVGVDADDGRGGVGLGQEHRGGAEAAADVEDPATAGQPLVHAVERGRAGSHWLTSAAR
jgi:hypothetical protein